MLFIKDLHEGDRISGIYLCKSRVPATTKNGKMYENLVIQDKTGSIDAKIWEPDSSAIDSFEALDYVDIVGDVTQFAGSLQLNIKRARKAEEGEYNESDYLPVSRYSIDKMYDSLLAYLDNVEEPHLKELLDAFFKHDEEFISSFKKSSAAKSVHHGFIGGLLEHTFGVVRLCSFYSKAYPMLNKDLLIASAALHDIGKIRELSSFPMNDYTDEGQMVGHIVIGVEMIDDVIKNIDGFPALLAFELRHCILSHHGEMEYGSPKKPALAEALALHLADLTDARMESMYEALNSGGTRDKWLGYNRIFESNIRITE